MGNELVSQVGNVTGTSAAAASNYSTNLSAGVPNMLLNNAFNGKDYSNDFIMPDWLRTGNISEEQRASIFGPVYNQHSQTAQVQTQQRQNQPTNNQPAFNGQDIQQQMTPEELSEYYEKLLAQNSNLRITEKGNLYEKSNTGKIAGILTGIGVALYDGIKKLCNGTELKSAFNIKSLAVKLPILAVAGWAAGSLIDAFFNSSKAKQADVQAQNV